ncbi:PREDICTED: hematopoietic prostaglandin D synthase-like [Branchiostoma belcheri]|uniref:glutathione transferase n=1 Tax=Branchiostoma belcheri TaxID=7741 RepID=A0A6P5A304_BRABE|nr:PREDICTED: hematopoietic prostaglandin D synthase-like [Branchiostoma belcheri]
MAQPKYRLIYFNLRARAEATRLVFAAAGVEYEDVRIPRDKWPDLKPNTPMGQLPVLEVGGVTLCQSMAIARFAAKETGLAGKTALEQAHADMLVDGIDDLRGKQAVIRKASEDRKEQCKKELADFAPDFLGKYEKLCGPHGHLVGDSLTWADLVFYDVMSKVLAVLPGALDGLPRLAKVMDTVTANEGVAAWLAKRPDTPH